MIAIRKIFLMAGIFNLAICLCACSGMGRVEGSLPDYVSLDQLAEGYGIENAVDDGCVVIDDFRLVSGEDVWQAFMAEAGKEQPCRVRIAEHYSTESLFSLADLSYDGSAFRVDTDEGLSKEYKYLNHYEINAENSVSDDSITDCYMLMNQENITYDEFEKSMAGSIAYPVDSSNPDEALDFFIVFIYTR